MWTFIFSRSLPIYQNPFITIPLLLREPHQLLNQQKINSGDQNTRIPKSPISLKTCAKTTMTNSLFLSNDGHSPPRVKPRVYALKIDMEGFEPRALMGATRIQKWGHWVRLAMCWWPLFPTVACRMTTNPPAKQKRRHRIIVRNGTAGGISECVTGWYHSRVSWHKTAEHALKIHQEVAPWQVSLTQAEDHRIG